MNRRGFLKALAGTVATAVAAPLASATAKAVVEAPVVSTIPTIQIESSTIVAANRKLKAVWSYEAAQDLKNMHGPSISDELSKQLLKDLAEEIDREILADIKAGL